MRIFAHTLLLALVLLPACGGSEAESGDRVEYSASASKNYQLGMKKLGDEDRIESAKYFTFVKARFPYSKFAVLAELRLADTEFGAGSYTEAIDSYKLFIKFHPTHDMTSNGYAQFRVGEAYYKMLPSDWFLVPPSYEKDQSATHDALRELTQFLRKYPKSPYTTKAEKMRNDCAHSLAATEWYIATFYWKRDRPTATVLRLRTLLARYRGAGYDEEALWLLGKALKAAGKKDEAKAAWEELVKGYPTHPRAHEAKGALGK
jgi:outer membrane protein assembly factor BamD